MFFHGLLFVCFVCAATTGVLAMRATPVCTKLGLMDVPSDRKMHMTATPLLGGLALGCVILPVMVLGIVWFGRPEFQQSLLFYVVAAVAMALLGMADDRRSLAARDRILLSMLIFGSIAIVDPLFNVRTLSFATAGFEIGLALTPLAVIFTTICCVGLVNAVNMADGKNGLVVSLCLGWLGLMGLRAPEPLLFPILILCSGLVVLLGFNLKGRLFLGDGGSYGFATAVGLLSIAIYNSPGRHMGRAISAEELMLLFATPVLDSFRLTFVRLRRGQSPMAADRDHLHHHLQNKFGWPGGLLVYLAIALLPAAVVMTGVLHERGQPVGRGASLQSLKSNDSIILSGMLARGKHVPRKLADAQLSEKYPVPLCCPFLIATNVTSSTRFLTTRPSIENSVNSSMFMG